MWLMSVCTGCRGGYSYSFIPPVGLKRGLKRARPLSLGVGRHQPRKIRNLRNRLCYLLRYYLPSLLLGSAFSSLLLLSSNFKRVENPAPGAHSSETAVRYVQKSGQRINLAT